MHYTGMDVWQRSVDLAVEIYEATGSLPREEMYGMRAQIRRAAVSIASNIAEGMGRNTHGEETQFLAISRGSLFELQTQLTLCERLHYLTPERVQQLIALTDRVAMLINGTLRSLKDR